MLTGRNGAIPELISGNDRSDAGDRRSLAVASGNLSVADIRMPDPDAFHIGNGVVWPRLQDADPQAEITGTLAGFGHGISILSAS